jgi:hypothetical protein
MATAMLAMMMSTATGSLPQTATSALRTRATPSAPPPSHNISFGVPLALGSVGATDGVSPPLVFTDNGTIAVVVSGASGAYVRVCVCACVASCVIHRGRMHRGMQRVHEHITMFLQIAWQ